MKLRIVGAEGLPDPKIPPAIKAAVKFLTNAPDGDLYLTPSLAAAVSLSPRYLQSWGSHAALAKMRHKTAMNGTIKVIWGNPRTIAAAKKASAAA